MTHDEQLTALRERVEALEWIVQLFKRGVNPYTGRSYLMTRCPLGVMTEYWARQATGQGAAFSVSTATDRFAVYAEVDGISCPDHPTTAVYAAVVAPNERQSNIAVEAHAANAPHGNVPFYGGYQYAPSARPVTEGVRLEELSADGLVQRRLSISANGMTLADGIQSALVYVIVKVGGAIKRLWP